MKKSMLYFGLGSLILLPLLLSLISLGVDTVFIFLLALSALVGSALLLKGAGRLEGVLKEKLEKTRG